MDEAVRELLEADETVLVLCLSAVTETLGELEERDEAWSLDAREKLRAVCVAILTELGGRGPSLVN
jgi:hypothetical protein